MIKILCLNAHKGYGWHLKPTLKLLDLKIKALRPDIIFLQEILGKDTEYLMLDNWPYYSYGKNASHLKNHYGNAILSKFPIIFSENFDLSMHRFEHRGLLYSIITLPENKNIHLLCVHLGLFHRGRKNQLKIITDHIDTHIPIDAPIILAGDFNDWSNKMTETLVEEFRLQEVFLTKYGAYAKTFPAWRPFLKLDRIYFRGFEIIFAERLNEKSWRMLSDHLGLHADLQPLI